VARALGLEHSIVDADVDRYPEFLGTQLTWEHLAGGLQILYDWGLIPILQRFSGGLATGFFTDAVVGGGAQYRFRAPQGPPSYDGTFAAENAWGLAPRVVKRLLRKDDARELVNDELSRYRDEFDELPGSDLQRSWLLDLRRRQRFHTGRLLWSLSFGAWPMTPMLDRQVLRVAASIQPGTMADRAAQRGIMTRRFPRLARLPIDRNSGDTTPLAPSLRWRATRAARNALAGAHLVRRKVMRHEELFYFRVLDFNSAGWRAIRKLADERKDGVGNLLRVEALDEVLPPWDASTRLQWPLVGSAGLKMLAGMILWLGETGVPAGGEGLAGTGMPVPAGSGS
jgi:asparagine synthase (glutamine-hydrolysing)